MSLRILITGANRGLGLELARQLADRGDDVLATYRDSASADDLMQLGVRTARLDVSDTASVESLVESLPPGGLDLLINNAGIGVGHRELGHLDYERVSRYFETNAVGPLRLTESLLPQLKAGRRKLIVNMTSRMGSIGDNTSGDAYGYRASKAALNMFTRSLAIDLAKDGFICVVLHPGWVQTDMGGPSASVPVGESVAGLLRVIDGLGPADSGRFFDFSGQEIAW